MVKFKILRSDAESMEEPKYEEFEVGLEPGKTVLDGLREIKAEQDGSLTFRTACEAGVCGSCAMEINSKPRLACRTQLVRDLDIEAQNGEEEVVRIKPLPGFDVIKDLVVDIDPFFDSIGRYKPYLVSDDESEPGEERLQKPEDMMLVDDPMSCIMCTACLSACPVNWSESLYPGPAVLTKVARFSLDSRDTEKRRLDLINDDIWECTTCNYCFEVCPKDIEIPENIVKMKEYFVEQGRIPSELKDSLRSIYTQSNPYQESTKGRIEWSEGLDVSRYEDQKYLWYVGCTLAYDNRSQEVAKSMIRIFNEVGEDYGILGKDEKCCGHPAKKAGERGLFEEISEENSHLFKELEADAIITNCAHSYHSFSNEYPPLELEILHSTQYLNRILNEISLSRRLDKKITYHDSCYLGRYNEVYEEPRKVISNIPGAELVEMERNKEIGLCCGGGSNHMWMDEPDYSGEEGKRLAQKRIEEALDINADVIAVACPFCLATLDGAVTGGGYEEEIEVKSVSELIAEAI